MAADHVVHDYAAHRFGVIGLYGGAQAGEPVIEVLAATFDEPVGVEDQDRCDGQMDGRRRALDVRRDRREGA